VWVPHAFDVTQWVLRACFGEPETTEHHGELLFIWKR
jgi:hypothetical protein